MKTHPIFPNSSPNMVFRPTVKGLIATAWMGYSHKPGSDTMRKHQSQFLAQFLLQFWGKTAWKSYLGVFSLCSTLFLIFVASPASEGAPPRRNRPGAIATQTDVPGGITQTAKEKPAKEEPAKKEKEAKESKQSKLELCELAPAKYWPGLCLYEYPISCKNPETQKLFNQGLGYLYSYVWMEAARSMETAAKLEPDCPIIWWGLARAFHHWGKNAQANKALTKAKEALDKASPKEKALIRALLQEKGMEAGVGDQDARKKVAIATLDELIAEFPSDQEAWWMRGQLAGNFALFGGNKSTAPFYHAILRINPVHPGANHELTHFYEQIRRPALGMPYANGYIESSPGLPHAFHMQAHLATRIGRWDKTGDRSSRAVELQKEYHKNVGVEPKDDHQYSHHLEILFISLTHDGRFAEARVIMEDARKAKYEHFLPWVRFALVSRDFDLATKLVAELRKKDKNMAAYAGAWLALEQGRFEDALAEVEALRQAVASNPKDTKLSLWLNEMQGWLYCVQGDSNPGLELIERTVRKTKDDFSHHSWGLGATLMERWGLCAMATGKTAVAEEAFLEAVAHDPGSVVGAVGLEELCRRQGRTDEMNRYGALADKAWQRAQPSDLAELRRRIAGLKPETRAQREDTTGAQTTPGE